MSTFIFNDLEKQAIRNAITKRRSNCQGYNKHQIELDKIEKELLFHVSSITPKYTSIVIGCLRETYINPNKDILYMSEYNLIFNGDRFYDRFEELDIALKLLNKLIEKQETKHRLISDSLTKIEDILNSNEILYSMTTDGKVYKAAILVDETNGVSFELDGFSEPVNFEIRRISRQYYMNSGTPSEIRCYLNDYSRNVELSIMQKCFLRILDHTL